MSTKYLGESFIYILYSVGDTTEPISSPSCIALGVDIPIFTQTLNFLYQRKEAIISGFFDTQGHHCHRHFMVEIKCVVVLKRHTMKYRVVMCTETKLAYICLQSAFVLFSQ
jgi:hypothetical protein